MEDVGKSELFDSLGYATEHERLNRYLAEIGLTNPEKSRIAGSKRAAVAEALQARFVRVCVRGDCQAHAPTRTSGRTVVQATAPAHCEICEGSALTRAREEMREACRAAGWQNLCIVGGSPKAREEIENTMPPDLRVRTVDGVATRRQSDAKHDLKWADAIVVWGGTQLHHRVSNLYASPKTTLATRRSVQEVYAHIAAEARRSCK